MIVTINKEWGIDFETGWIYRRQKDGQWAKHHRLTVSHTEEIKDSQPTSRTA